MDAPTLSKALQSEFILNAEGQFLPEYAQSLSMGSYGSTAITTEGAEVEKLDAGSVDP